MQRLIDWGRIGNAELIALARADKMDPFFAVWSEGAHRPGPINCVWCIVCVPPAIYILAVVYRIK
jgi:hypothetical protein